MKGSPITCLTNPRAGRERALELTSSRSPRRVLVLGAGVAGMQAAIAAARQGHTVRIWEKASAPGGTWRSAASLPPGREEYGRLTDYLQAEIARLGVALDLGVDASPDTVCAYRPDFVVLATGAVVDGEHTGAVRGDRSVSVVNLRRGLFASPPRASDRVALVGSSRQLWEAARWLDARGSAAVFLCTAPTVAPEASSAMQRIVQQQLRASSFDVFCGVDAVVISDGDLWTLCDGIIEPAGSTDLVVVDGGLGDQGSMLADLRGRGLDVVAVGDAAGARDALRASHEGFLAGHLADGVLMSRFLGDLM